MIFLTVDMRGLADLVMSILLKATLVQCTFVAVVSVFGLIATTTEGVWKIMRRCKRRSR